MQWAELTSICASSEDTGNICTYRQPPTGIGLAPGQQAQFDRQEPVRKIEIPLLPNPGLPQKKGREEEEGKDAEGDFPATDANDADDAGAATEGRRDKAPPRWHEQLHRKMRPAKAGIRPRDGESSATPTLRQR